MTVRWLAPVFALLFPFATNPASAQTPIAASAGDWYTVHPVASETRAVTATVDASPARNAEGHFPLMLGAFLTAASADLAVSMYQIGRGTAHEAAFGSAWEHAPVAFALSKSGAAAMFAMGIQRLHKDRPKAALVLGLSATIVESMLVVRAARMSPLP